MGRNSGFVRSIIACGALLEVLACGGGDLTLPGGAGPATALQLVSGNEQSAQAGEELAAPLVVRLVDNQGNAVNAAAVSWVVGAGGGSVSPATVQTDSAGLASARLTLGPSAGLNTVNAVVSGLEVVTFTANALESPGGPGGGDPSPDHLVFQVQPSDANQRERITPPVVVAVVDQTGEVVTDFQTKIELSLVGGPGKLEGDTREDTKDGVATFDDLKVDKPGSGLVLQARAPEASFLGTVESQPFDIEEN